MPPGIHSIVKPQMLGRSRGMPWLWRKNFLYNLAINVLYRVAFHTADGLHATLDCGLNLAAFTASDFKRLVSYTDLVGTNWVGNQWHYGACYLYDGFHTPGADWRVAIFPWWTGFAAVPGWLVAAPPTFPVAGGDTNFYVLSIKDDGATADGTQVRTAYWTCNRLNPGSPATQKANFIEQQNDTSGTGRIFLDSVTVLATRNPTDPDEL